MAGSDPEAQLREWLDTRDAELFLGVTPESTRKFENMMVGYFGLRDRDALYQLREVVERTRELWEEKRLPETR